MKPKSLGIKRSEAWFSCTFGAIYDSLIFRDIRCIQKDMDIYIYKYQAFSTKKHISDTFPHDHGCDQKPPSTLQNCRDSLSDNLPSKGRIEGCGNSVLCPLRMYSTFNLGFLRCQKGYEESSIPYFWGLHVLLQATIVSL
jgi:hypothetical protein